VQLVYLLAIAAAFDVLGRRHDCTMRVRGREQTRWTSNAGYVACCTPINARLWRHGMKLVSCAVLKWLCIPVLLPLSVGISSQRLHFGFMPGNSTCLTFSKCSLIYLIECEQQLLVATRLNDWGLLSRGRRWPWWGWPAVFAAAIHGLVHWSDWTAVRWDRCLLQQWLLSGWEAPYCISLYQWTTLSTVSRQPAQTLNVYALLLIIIWVFPIFHSQISDPKFNIWISRCRLTTLIRFEPIRLLNSNPISIDAIRIESTAGSNSILIVKIRTAVDHAAW